MAGHEHDGIAGSPESDEAYLMRRVMKLSDENKALSIDLTKLGARLDHLEHAVESLQTVGATREQLSSMEAIVTLKIDNLHAELAPMKNGIYAVVGILVTAVIGGLLTLLMKPGIAG